MSALYQKRTHALQQTASLFYHIVGGVEKRWCKGDAKRLCGLEADRELVFRRLLKRQNRDMSRAVKANAIPPRGSQPFSPRTRPFGLRLAQSVR